jgi:hypothetical protein
VRKTQWASVYALRLIKPGVLGPGIVKIDYDDAVAKFAWSPVERSQFGVGMVPFLKNRRHLKSVPRAGCSGDWS